MFKPAIVGHRAPDDELDARAVFRLASQILAVDPRRLFKPDGSAAHISDLDDDTAASIASLEIDKDGGLRKVTFLSKPKVLELLARCTGLVDVGRIATDTGTRSHERRH
jgi:hypothetical protein